MCQIEYLIFGQINRFVHPKEFSYVYKLIIPLYKQIILTREY
jgi:hypothetical protein